MRLAHESALSRLHEHDHGVLATVHPARGVDAVPVVYTVVDGHVGIPIDRVKPKSTTRLQRRHNLEADPRATLLIEQWDRDDWSRLWWVRAELRWVGDVPAPPTPAPPTAALAERLAATFDQYRDQPFADLLVLDIVAVTGWTAT